MTAVRPLGEQSERNLKNSDTSVHNQMNAQNSTTTVKTIQMMFQTNLDGKTHTHPAFSPLSYKTTSARHMCKENRNTVDYCLCVYAVDFALHTHTSNLVFN